MRTGEALVLRLRPAIHLTREQFFQFCQLNPEVRIERMADGDIAIMAPTGGETSARNLRLSAQVGVGRCGRLRCRIRLFGRLRTA